MQPSAISWLAVLLCIVSHPIITGLSSPAACCMEAIVDVENKTRSLGLRVSGRYVRSLVSATLQPCVAKTIFVSDLVFELAFAL